jgi:hypothetical protein
MGVHMSRCTPLGVRVHRCRVYTLYFFILVVLYRDTTIHMFSLLLWPVSHKG